MVTLQEKSVKFNNHLIVSHDGGRLSSDSGLILIDELMDAFDFTQLSEAIVLFKEDRKYWKHSPLFVKWFSNFHCPLQSRLSVKKSQGKRFSLKYLA